MKTVGIIAEFNPFHNGHKYLIQQAKLKTGAENVIIVCSGNYVQRGIPAIYDKYTRAKMTIENGADLILELPVYYATASAELFARGAISLLEQLNCIDYLCFGCEFENLEILSCISEILSEEPLRYQILLKDYLSHGCSFPKARALALEQYGKAMNLFNSVSIEEILSGSNNILAIEYLKALKLFRSSIQPIAVKRLGSEYNSTSIHSSFASSTGIREAIIQGKLRDVSNHIPKNCIDFLEDTPRISMKNFDLLFGERLLTHSSFDEYFGISKELSNRIFRNRKEYISLNSFTELLQSKNYTYTGISRALLHICLNIKKEDLECLINSNYHFHIRVLAFRKASNTLSVIKKQSSLPIIGKFADYYNKTTGKERICLQKSIYCDHLYRLLQMQHCNHFIPTEFQQQIIIFC